MKSYSVLVDSSVWIEYFRGSDNALLESLIKEDLVVINDVILTDLEPALLHSAQKNIIQSLTALPVIPLDIDWKIIRKYQHINLQNGINKVGIPDLIIMQQVVINKLTLFSLDKHFKLMSQVINFDLLPE